MAEQLSSYYRRLIDNPELFEQESSRACAISNKDDVSSDLLSQAEKYLVWARMAAFAESDYQFMEKKLDQMMYECRRAIRSRLQSAAAGGKTRVTEERIKEEAALDPNYLFQQEASLRAWRLWQQFKAVAMAMWQRYENLKSLNIRQCKELSTYPAEEY